MCRASTVSQSHKHSLLLCPYLFLFPLLVRWSNSQYDNRADDLTKDGMLKGIESSAAFVLFLSTGVLERPYCQMEIRHALALKKPVVLLHGESEHEMSLCSTIDIRLAPDACPLPNRLLARPCQ